MTDMMEHLQSLADGVRGMGVGDPDADERVEASDVVRWAVTELARLRLTDAEREAVEEGMRQLAESDCIATADALASIATLRGLIERHFPTPEKSERQETTPQDSAAMSPASTGSVEPVAWGVIRPDGLLACASHSRGGCQSVCFEGDEVVPLYRSPLLTAAEREAAAWAVFEFGAQRNGMAKERAATLRGLLERTE